jgi:hypothetical protein
LLLQGALGAVSDSNDYQQLASAPGTSCADLLQQLLARCQHAAEELQVAGGLLGQARAALFEHQPADEESSMAKVSSMYTASVLKARALTDTYGVSLGTQQRRM